jgi:hypothetical protein
VHRSGQPVHRLIPFLQLSLLNPLFVSLSSILEIIYRDHDHQEMIHTIVPPWEYYLTVLCAYFLYRLWHVVASHHGERSRQWKRWLLCTLYPVGLHWSWENNKSTDRAPMRSDHGSDPIYGTGTRSRSCEDPRHSTSQLCSPFLGMSTDGNFPGLQRPKDLPKLLLR